MLQGGDGSTGDSHPVHVQFVWGADDAVVSGPVKAVELAVSQTDI